MPSTSKQLKLNREKGLKKIRKKFGLRKQKSYADYLKENAKNGDKDCKSQIRKFNRKKGRID